LSSLFGPEVEVESAVPTLVTEQLFDDERQLIARAVATRQAQFGTARVCARRALARLGVAPCSLAPHADRSPSWPAGIKGSIAHTAQHCAVAVSSSTRIRAIGLDLESDAPLKPGLQAVICTEAERVWLDGFDPRAMAWLGPLVFSAKEAFYKCQFPLTRTPLGFEHVRLEFDLHVGSFVIGELAPHVPQRELLLRIEGKFRRLTDLLVTSAVLRA
jgi:4'-phosphopantetheinyl transferase EntD